MNEKYREWLARQIDRATKNEKLAIETKHGEDAALFYMRRVTYENALKEFNELCELYA
jgi:hypothetical protein